MKFPYELSEDRLSLLSKLDRELYEYEHSIYYSKVLKENSILEYQKALLESQGYYLDEINEDSEFDDMPIEEKKEMAEALSKMEALEIFETIKDIFEDLSEENGISKEDYNAACQRCYDSIINIDINDELYDKLSKEEILNEDIEALNEYHDLGNPGNDGYYWLNDLWIGKMAGALLGGLFATLGGLLVAGKDLVAMKALERYMNKLVEMIDNGQNKKKSIFNYIGLGKNRGNQSQGCFRSIQENIERNRYTQGLIWAKAAGLLGNDAINDAIANNTNNGGLTLYFDKNIGDKINACTK